jgi:AraC family carnitine catabolism transcriptional activator
MMSVVNHDLQAVPAADLVLVLASYDPLATVDARILGWLRGRALAGSHLGAADTGAYVLARAGLLDGYQATVHWETLDDFQERFPGTRTQEALYVVDRRRLTAAGATACLDLMLHVIHCRHGRELAVSVAEQFVYSPMREAHQAQRHSLIQRLRSPNPNIQRAVEIMESRVEDPVPTRQVADRLGISLRELERIFRRWLRTTPGAYYRHLRLERARSLLEQTDRSVTEIAYGCGFGSLPSFSRSYKRAFGHSPSTVRRR